MSDTATKILTLLERLSVVAPERCKLSLAGSVYMTLSATARGICVARGDALPLLGEAVILRGVLEEAHTRELDWEIIIESHTLNLQRWKLKTRDGQWLLPSVRIPKEGGILEREVLPRLELLVLWLEAQP